jgi:hypothetical protein
MAESGNKCARVTVTFVIRNVCNQQDPEKLGMTFDEIVRSLIDSEGLYGLVEDEYSIDKIKEA